MTTEQEKRKGSTSTKLQKIPIIIYYLVNHLVLKNDNRKLSFFLTKKNECYKLLTYEEVESVSLFQIFYIPKTHKISDALEIT